MPGYSIKSMADQKPAERTVGPTEEGSPRKGVVGPRLIRPQSPIAMSFVFNVVPRKPLIAVHGARVFIDKQEYRVWIDANSRAFAVEHGEDPNE